MAEEMKLRMQLGPTGSQATDTRLEARRKHELARNQGQNIKAREARRRRFERMRRLTQFARSRGAAGATRVGSMVVDAAQLRGPMAFARNARMLANPYVAIAAAVIVATAIAVRLGTGRSFENMGNNLRTFLFGDASSDAIAGMEAREMLAGDERFARIVGMEGKANSQMREVFEGLKRIRKIDALGRELMENDPEMQRNNTVDNLILRAQQLTIESWKASGGPEAINRWASMYQEQGQTTSPR